jgi:hypothetical protein
MQPACHGRDTSPVPRERARRRFERCWSARYSASRSRWCSTRSSAVGNEGWHAFQASITRLALGLLEPNFRVVVAHPGINMSDVKLPLMPVLLLAVSACSTRAPPTSLEPVATIQELMQAEVDASADSIWDAVETTISPSGEVDKQPHTAGEWRDVRQHAIVLIEAANLLTVENRRLSSAPFPAEAAGALDSAEIEKRIAGHRRVFNQYAVALRQTARTLLTAIDAHDPKGLVTAGGVLDEVCESCHMTFWYPNQVIPALPSPTK